MTRVKEGVRDARLLLGAAPVMSVSVSWPFVVNRDSKKAISFQQDTCPKSRIEGRLGKIGGRLGERLGKIG